jgi:hypothetical protein
MCSTALLGLIFVFGAGCSRGNSKVQGKVTLNGQPLDLAEVNFHPAESDNAAGAFGAKTDAQGNFQAPFPPSLREGNYKVTVVKYMPVEGVTLPPEFDIEMAKRTGKVKNTLPANYDSPLSSPLVVKVKAGQKDLKIELSRQ